MTDGTTPSARPGLRLTGLTKVLGGRRIVEGLDLVVPEGELICLLGPSGCGKTTTLRMIGGFLTPDAGRLEIGGRDYTSAPPERRPTAMVFQNYALWPHMSVAANIAFGLRVRRLERRAIREKVDWALDLVRLRHHRDTMPARISGGEQQRVALARALVLEPEVLLMDEPLSNLDAKLRGQVREEIRDIQQRLGITTVLVTHDQDEALSVADRIAVMNGGRIEQDATPDELYSWPRTTFVADFIGAMNFFDGPPCPGGIALADGSILPVERFSAQSDARVALGQRIGDRVGVRPEEITLHAIGAEGSAPAEVVRVYPRGHFQEIVLRSGDSRIRCFAGSAIEPGSTVGVRARRALLYRDGLLRRDVDPAVV